MAEWFKAHAWKACVAKHYRGFKSHSLRHSSKSIPVPIRNRNHRSRFLGAASKNTNAIRIMIRPSNSLTHLSALLSPSDFQDFSRRRIEVRAINFFPSLIAEERSKDCEEDEETMTNRSSFGVLRDGLVWQRRPDGFFPSGLSFSRSQARFCVLEKRQPATQLAVAQSAA